MPLYSAVRWEHCAGNHQVWSTCSSEVNQASCANGFFWFDDIWGREVLRQDAEIPDVSVGYCRTIRNYAYAFQNPLMALSGVCVCSSWSIRNSAWFPLRLIRSDMVGLELI